MLNCGALNSALHVWALVQVSLTNIDITGSLVSDGGMVHLSRLTELKRFTARGRPITGAGLRILSHLRKLEVLEIAGTVVDDFGAQHMTQMTNLWKLGMCGTKVCATRSSANTQLYRFTMIEFEDCQL